MPQFQWHHGRCGDMLVTMCRKTNTKNLCSTLEFSFLHDVWRWFFFNVVVVVVLLEIESITSSTADYSHVLEAGIVLTNDTADEAWFANYRFSISEPSTVSRGAVNWAEPKLMRMSFHERFLIYHQSFRLRELCSYATTTILSVTCYAKWVLVKIQMNKADMNQIKLVMRSI